MSSDVRNLNGYVKVRTNGSHEIYKNESNTISVPCIKLNMLIAKRLIKENNLTIQKGKYMYRLTIYDDVTWKPWLVFSGETKENCVEQFYSATKEEPKSLEEFELDYSSCVEWNK